MKSIRLFFCLALLPLMAGAQAILPSAWKFHTGDNPAWSAPGFNDAGWDSVRAGRSWESQGHDYDGFAWYRTRVVIPHSLQAASWLKGGLDIRLGKIDDGDQVYLNGKLIGQNGEDGGTIQDGNAQVLRVYRLPLNDPAIHWDQENVIAVRVYDHGGRGGMWEGPYSVSITGLPDVVTIDDHASDFHFTDGKEVEKKIMLETTGNYDFSGTLTVTAVDPANGKSVWEKTVDAHFSGSSPFSYRYSMSLPDRRSYRAVYAFRESRSGKVVKASEGIPYILTPTPPQQPRINGATVTSVRPGHPFLFRVPVSGKRPMQISAKGLPSGLQIDGSTGIITGTVAKEGTYPVTITASNSLGSDSRILTIKVGQLIALTPAMGWNSWNVWGLSVNEQKVEAAADVMVKKGLVNHGWTYINMDDGWERPQRAADGEVVPNAKFPDMKAMVDYIHHLGLKAGIYSSPGPNTCGGFLGSYGHEAQDAATYAKWGIDYLKYDWCSYRRIAPPHPDLMWLQKPYKLMDSALHQVNRDIYFSLCQYGMGDVWKWGASVGGNSWRTTGDIRDNWKSMAGIGFNQGKCAPYAQPGHWNDPDMLVVGKVGWGPSVHSTNLTPDEQYTHISLWCMLSAPLLIGCDMRQLDDFTLSLLTNDEVLALDQDPLGKEAVQVAEDDSVRIYEKELSDGSRAVGFFNVGSTVADARVKLSVLGLHGKQYLRDLWRQKDIGSCSGSYHARDIPPHGVLLLKMSAKRTKRPQ
jgi:hypothetical protein